MSARSLKAELASLSVPTGSLFEKADLLAAVLAARASPPTTEGPAEPKAPGKTGEDGGYKEVEVQKMGPPGGGGAGKPGPGPGGGGGVADMLKNMGGMGGIEDMLKNMGGGGGGMGGMADMLKNMGGGVPGGVPGAGGGDMMGMAQKLMQNPKAMALVQKAQGNPKVMQAVTECMSNPAAFAKYQGDPEIKELLDELRKIM
ncbi:hypothetical protein TeGR_g11011 [Tetraparma gracilis]|uniref:STI1 domain-containing protein n=1 Tax=Tetraparma gracilis TaxID=2962635 RepID=A0ABQ6N7S9_9STRA|nr:hypothetical protein TeGR_g11011 [Tetraparma gracilis]